jgi:PIN domain nuclease of toxin-antitoxin system
MGKVKIVNNTLQLLNLLVKESGSNKTVQLLSKQDIIIDTSSVTDQINRLRDLGAISVLPYTEVIIV